MKTIKLSTLGTVALCFIQACGDKPKTGTVKQTTSYEIYSRDTINLTDGNGYKQGHWVIFDNVVQNTALTKSPPDKPENETQKSLTSPTARIPLEEGDYKDNKKQGVWKYYSSDGALKNSAEYKDDVVIPKQS